MRKKDFTTISNRAINEDKAFIKASTSKTTDIKLSSAELYIDPLLEALLY